MSAGEARAQAETIKLWLPERLRGWFDAMLADRDLRDGDLDRVERALFGGDFDNRSVETLVKQANELRADRDRFTADNAALLEGVDSALTRKVFRLYDQVSRLTAERDQALDSCVKSFDAASVIHAEAKARVEVAEARNADLTAALELARVSLIDHACKLPLSKRDHGPVLVAIDAALAAASTAEPPKTKHECPRCGSDEWSYVDYGGCSECRPYEERATEDAAAVPPERAPLDAEGVLWVAALDRVPAEDRVEWVKEMVVRVEQINAVHAAVPPERET